MKLLSKIKNIAARISSDVQWYTPDDQKPKEQCPCCDYVSLPERGNYLICPICFWEDDGQDIDNIDDKSGPNHGITLRQGRENFRQLGACEPEMVQYVVPTPARADFEFKPRPV